MSYDNKLNAQICASKNNRTLVEFVDALHFEKGKAWPEFRSSRIKMKIVDYSNKSKDQNSVSKWCNLTVSQIKELLRKASKLTDINDKPAVVAKSTLEKVYAVLESNPGIEPEELELVSKGIKELDSIIADANKIIILHQDKKILDYPSYKNKENDAERLTTGCKISYNPAMNYPIIIEIGQGYATPVREASGQVKYKNEHDYVVLKKMLSIDDFIDMLEKVVTFSDSMIGFALKDYYEASVSGFAEKTMNFEE